MNKNAKTSSPKKHPKKLNGATQSQCRPRPLPKQDKTAVTKETMVIPAKSIDFPPKLQIFFIILYLSKGNKCKFPCSGVEIA
jgi:hypothetical protein